MTVETIGIVGCGQMGIGITEVSALAGYRVIIYGRREDVAPTCHSRLQGSLERVVRRGKIGASQAKAALARVQSTADLAQLAAADLVIECVAEDLALKHTIFRSLDDLSHPAAILATNTSALSITAIANVTRRSDRILGMHFFNPVPVMKLLELVRGLDTSDETIAVAHTVGARLGKTTITAPDRPGFIVNRLLIPYLIDVIRSHEAGLESIEAIDRGVKAGLGHPLGPLALADLIGLDTTLAIADVLYASSGDPAFKAPPLLRQMVRLGRLGRKTGVGFFSYRR